VDHWTIHVSLV